MPPAFTSFAMLNLIHAYRLIGIQDHDPKLQDLTSWDEYGLVCFLYIKIFY